MNWQPPQWPKPPRELPAHLSELGQRLQDLATEVRGSVANLTGDALGRVVRDALMRFWRQLPAPTSAPRPHATHSAYDGADDPEADPWRSEEPNWQEEYRSPVAPTPPDRSDSEKGPPMAQLFALALHAGGWWLQRYGTWLGALGVGCTVGGVALIGGRAAIVGLNLIQSVSELYALNNVLSSGSKALNSD